MGAEAGQGGVGQVIHHPVDVLLQEDGHVAGQRLKGLPVLDDGAVGKDPLHQVGGQVEPADGRVVQTHRRGVGKRGLDVSVQTQVGQPKLEVFGSEANQENSL